MKYLTKTTETYRVDSEAEVLEMIKSAKESSQWILEGHSSKKKQVKQKGEVVDEYFMLTLTKSFNDEKEPMDDITVVYNGEECPF
jgi:hypothetical protein